MDPVDICVPHYGDRNLLGLCARSVAANTPTSFTFIVHDNTIDNVGFAAGCNQAAARGTAPNIVFLNNDCFVRPGWLPPLLAAVRQPDIGVVGAQLLYNHGGIQHSGVGLRNRADGTLEAYNFTDLRDPGPVDAVTGALLMIRRTVFEQLDGFDEAFYNGYEDVDLCIRARQAGHHVWYAAESTAIHLESQSGPERWAKVRENVALLQRWR